MTGRPEVLGREMMVATGHHTASQVAVEILTRRGNAMDAAVAAAATLAVVKPWACGLGGDAFFLHYLGRSKMVAGINASGGAPAMATAERFAGGIPTTGPLSIAGPGALAGWIAGLERFGSRPLAELLMPAIDLAERGFPVSDSFLAHLTKHAPLLQRYPASAALFLPGGRLPKRGERFVQKDLAATLRRIAAVGPDDFYCGQIAREMAAGLARAGAILGEPDLAAVRAEPVSSVSTTYRGLQVHVQPPVSQGHILLAELNLAEGFDLKSLGAGSAGAIHLLVEAKKLAFADRARYTSDPAVVKIPMRGMLSKAYAAERRRLIDPRRAALTVEAGDAWRAENDTTYLAVVDAAGEAVSFIQSIFHGFGSGVVAGPTGVLMNNRLANFSSDPVDVNVVAPGKRTTHTLTTCLVLDSAGSLRMVLGTPGGQGQVQTLLQVLVNLLDHGLRLQEAIEAPRWRSEAGCTLLVEEGIPPTVREDLAARGHELRVISHWSEELGGVQGILVDREAHTLMGGADPRREGFALGW